MHPSNDCSAASLKAVEVPCTKLTSEGWDAFAVKCGVSYRCAFAAIVVWQAADHLLIGLRWFEIYNADSGRKIGQCAVAAGRKWAAFADCLQLLPDCEIFWEAAMFSVLNQLGPGRYKYGSRWSVEPPRERSLENIVGVTIEASHEITVQAVDFTRWKCWSDYHGQISNNARRNAKRASVTHPTLRDRVRRKILTLLDAKDLVRLQYITASRKNINFPSVPLVLRFLLRSIAMRKYAITAVTMAGNRPLAAFSGIEFGQNTYYLTGCSEANNGGAAWHLMLRMIQDTYDRTQGSGKFLMGWVQEGHHKWENLAWSREQCRVTNFQTSIVTFSYLQPRMRVRSK